VITLSILILLIIALFSVVFFYKSDPNSITLYFLSETEDYDGNPTGRFSNIFPHTYVVENNKIIHSFLNSKKSFNNCKINDLNNWECFDNKLKFGLKKSIYFSNDKYNNLIQVSRYKYMLNLCENYRSEGLYILITKCPLIFLSNF
jgi:hypothetical protein